MEETWEEWLAHVVASINGSYNSSVGETLHVVVFRVDKRLPYDILLQTPRPLYIPEDYIELQFSVFQKIHRAVRSKLAISQEAMLARHHMSAQPVTIVEGDLVFMLDPDRTSKLSHKFSGPYRVWSRGHGNKFIMRSLDSGVVHVDTLKRFHPEFPLPLHLPEPAVTPNPEPLSPRPSTVDDYGSKLKSCRTYM